MRASVLATAIALPGLVSLVSLAASTVPPPSAVGASVPNYLVVTPQVASGGQPSAEALKQLKALGFRTVVNLRASSEPGGAEAEAVAKAAGLAYTHVPITPKSLSFQDAEVVEALLAKAETGPTLLYCASGNRAGGLWALIQIRGGKSLDEALAEGRRAGMTKPDMADAVTRLASDRASRTPAGQGSPAPTK